MPTLREAVFQWAYEFELDTKEMLDYALQDSLGGEDTGNWPAGSIWSCDGQMLYALIRAARIEDVLEFGTGHGCSTAHIAKALHDNGRGAIITLDKPDSVDLISYHVPEPYNTRVMRVLEDGLSWVRRSGGQFDLVFEDGPHTSEFTKGAIESSLPHLRPGGFVIVHDVYGPHGHQVWPGFRAALPDAKRIAVGPRYCPSARLSRRGWALTKAWGWMPCRGLGYWRKPN